MVCYTHSVDKKSEAQVTDCMPSWECLLGRTGQFLGKWEELFTLVMWLFGGTLGLGPIFGLLGWLNGVRVGCPGHCLSLQGWGLPCGGEGASRGM